METNIMETNSIPSSPVVPLKVAAENDAPAGMRWCKLIKKGDNSKLKESVGIAIPTLSVNKAQSLMTNPEIMAYVIDCLEKLQDSAVKEVVIKGEIVIQHYIVSDVTRLVSQLANSGVGQLSSDRIKNWFHQNLKDMLIVALSERLGISETATDAEITRLEAISAQTATSLCKLSAKVTPQFDDRIKKALDWALNVAITNNPDDAMAVRLKEKLHQNQISTEDMLINLGF